VNGDAAPGEFFRVHVAPRPCAEENDVLEASAFSDERRWQLGVVDNGDFGVAKHDRELVRGHFGIAIDGDRQISLTPQLFRDRGEGIVGIDKNSAQCSLPPPVDLATSIDVLTKAMR